MMEMTIGVILAVLWKKCDSHNAKLTLVSGFVQYWSLMDLSIISMSFSAQTMFWIFWRNLSDLFVKSMFDLLFFWKVHQLFFLIGIYQNHFDIGHRCQSK